jgi:hypothetical protein
LIAAIISCKIHPDSKTDLSKDNNYRLVAYDKKTISIGKLDAGASVLMIDHMEKDGKIEKSGDYNVYRTGELAATRKGERDM